MGAASQVTAQITAPRGGWWSPVVIQATQDAPQDRNGDNVGNILRDAVLGRPGEQGNARQDSRAPNARGRGNGNNQGNSNAQGNGRRNGNGPPFCRNGQGHPTKGWQWCEQKGWVGNTTWAREGWGDVIFGGGTPRQERPVNQGSIGGILGDVILGRLTRFGRAEGFNGGLDGRWVPVSRGSVLQVRMGGIPIAEFADMNRDGRADMVLLNYVH
jgi:hypothetical protein